VVDVTAGGLYAVEQVHECHEGGVPIVSTSRVDDPDAEAVDMGELGRR
jgi:hypothetical protein